MKFSEYRKSEGVNRSSETLLDISQQPKEQCPNVDSLLQDIANIAKDLERTAYELERNDETGELDTREIYSAASDLNRLEDDIEALRTAIIEIRAWGQEWKELAKSLLEEPNIDINDYIL